MYHGPVSISGEKEATSASFEGTGHEPSSARCGTHFLSLTAHLVKSPTTSFEKASPQRIWQSPSSARPVHVWMHSRLAAHTGFATHFASGIWQFFSRHLPIAAPSVFAIAAGGVTTELPSTSSAASMLLAALDAEDGMGLVRVGKRMSVGRTTGRIISGSPNNKHLPRSWRRR